MDNIISIEDLMLEWWME